MNRLAAENKDFLGFMMSVSRFATRRASGRDNQRDGRVRRALSGHLTPTISQTFLSKLRDTLPRIAPGSRPCHDDGARISAAPLWPLLRHCGGDRQVARAGSQGLRGSPTARVCGSSRGRNGWAFFFIRHFSPISRRGERIFSYHEKSGV